MSDDDGSRYGAEQVNSDALLVSTAAARLNNHHPFNA